MGIQTQSDYKTKPNNTGLIWLFGLAKTNLKQMKSREKEKSQQTVAPLSANKSLIKQNMRGITFTLLIKTHLQKKFVIVSQILAARTKSALTTINLE